MTAGKESSLAPLLEVKMGFIAANRKAFLKEGLIPTPLLGTPKRRAAKAALKVKQGESQTYSPRGETV
ncbi:hypothetical protein [Pseudorhizobium flavum]|uniref:Uncharacterized protein n=1 Tax=Pseudorhizobium flavum TaxID=1335061 RepID=A0A7X0DB14_9HYPH|nr:hypothetical protein [Pseudorhizobium flavum]MBB6178115.1 hypothetical protein [Pseudorhizobium flavum]